MADHPLLNPDLVTRVLLYLNPQFLERMAFVCSVWKDVTRSYELGKTEPYRTAFWQRFATQDENTLGEMEPAAPSSYTGTAGGVDWRAECVWRYAGGLAGWEATVEPRKICEMTGDVIFACAATLPSDLFICGGESGIIYFIDPDAPTEDQAIVFSFQAHASTITAVRAVRTGTKPHSTYLVISADVVNSVRVHNVDPFVAKTATRETDYVTHCAPTQVEIIHEVKDTLAAVVGLQDGRVVISEGWEKGEQHVAEAMHVEMVARDSPVNHIALVAPIPPVEGGELLEDQHTLAVTATAGPARTCFFHVKRGASFQVADDQLGLCEHMDLDISVSYRKALVTGTNIGLARDGTLALGYGDGKILAERRLPKHAYHMRRETLVQAHGDEVWDMCICGDIIYSTSRDKKLAAHTKKGRPVFTRDVGWVVRIKASPNRVFLLGFDSVLRVLERPMNCWRE